MNALDTPAGTDIRLDNVTKIYRTSAAEVVALENVTLSIDAGQAVALMGPSGCGKTTLLNLLGGMDRPDEGAVSVGGEDLAALGERALESHRLHRAGFVFQFFNLIPTLSAVENIELPMVIAGIPTSQRKVRSSELLGMVGLSEKGEKRPEELSGGEQQRIAICVALVNDPPLILADEPTGNLDSANAESITRLLVTLARERGKTVIVSSHDPNVVESFPIIHRMRDGRLVPPDEK